MTRLTDAYDELSSRAAPTDPGAVLAGARTEVRRRARRRRTTLAGVGVAAALAVVVGLVARDDGGRVETDDGPVATSPTTAPPAPSTAPSPAPSSTAPSTAPGPSTSTTPGAEGPTTTPAVPATTPAAGGRPGAATTGPISDTALVPKTADEIEALMRPGAVIEDVAITGGNVDVVADDVTLRNFRLDAGGAPYGFRSTGGKTGFVAEDGEIVNTASAGFWGGGATFRRIEVHESGGSAFKPMGGVTIESSWWHHLGRGGGSANAVQFQGEGGAAGVTLRGNLCDLPASVAGAAGYGSSACVLVSTDAAVTATIEGNWFEGGSYTVDCDGQAGVAVRDNRFGRDLRNAPVRDCPTVAGNVWDDSGAPVP